MFSALLILLGLSAPVQAGSPDAPRLRIVASNYPLVYFAERIGGDQVDVSFPVPPDEDPAFWKPDAQAVVAMQKGDLILLNGADYEKWLPHVTLSPLKLVDTSAGFKNDLIRIENAVTHSHGPGGMHSHEGIANTTWLDFSQAAKQAEAVAQALIRKRPALKSVFSENLKRLQADLASMDAQMKTFSGLKPNQPLLGSHPVYQYLARRYALNLKSVHWEPNEMPPQEEWAKLRKLTAKHPAQWMIWEGKPLAQVSEKLQAEGIRALVFNPCANRPEGDDFLGVMRKNLENLGWAFR